MEKPLAYQCHDNIAMDKLRVLSQDHTNCSLLLCTGTLSEVPLQLQACASHREIATDTVVHITRRESRRFYFPGTFPNSLMFHC
ncbi:hypothetical protein KM043_006904 [Ampulex compressa]|nr:hypothetical protein KM043_006904 [Ampulex compressa]